MDDTAGTDHFSGSGRVVGGICKYHDGIGVGGLKELDGVEAKTGLLVGVARDSGTIGIIRDVGDWMEDGGVKGNTYV